MSEADPIRVLVVDDQDLVRGGFKAILGTYEGIEIVGEARNGADAVQEAQRLKPDVVLMDIRMPEMNGIEATRAITSNPLLAKTRVLVLTTFDVDEYVYDALGAGASGFLLKDADPDEIVAAIRVVARGDALIQPSVMRRLVETFVGRLGRRRCDRGSPRRADEPHRPRARDSRAGGPGPFQRRDRRGAVHLAGHGEDASGPRHG